MVEPTAYHENIGSPDGRAEGMSIKSPTTTVRFHIALADGSVRALPRSALTSPAGKSGTHVLMTRMGVRGIDLASSGRLTRE
ncbi:MAG: hypothetical protein U0638_07990 [Phycisphaerales bacterium]